jgi:hypothetical protein
MACLCIAGSSTWQSGCLLQLIPTLQLPTRHGAGRHWDRGGMRPVLPVSATPYFILGKLTSHALDAVLSSFVLLIFLYFRFRVRLAVLYTEWQGSATPVRIHRQCYHAPSSKMLWIWCARQVKLLDSLTRIQTGLWLCRSLHTFCITKQHLRSTHFLPCRWRRKIQKHRCRSKSVLGVVT